MRDNKKLNYSVIIKTVLLHILTDVVFIFIFAVAMYFLEDGYEYSPLFATLSLAAGCFVSALYLGIRVAKKGIIIGLAVGSGTFALVTLISMLVNNGAIGIHLLLRLVIMLLTSVIGGIIGVNRKSSEKFI